MDIQQFKKTAWRADTVARYNADGKIHPVVATAFDEYLVGLEITKGEITWVRCENVHLLSEPGNEIGRLNGKLESLLAVCREEGWNGVENSKCAATFLRTRFAELRTERDELQGQINKPRTCDTRGWMRRLAKPAPSWRA